MADGIAAEGRGRAYRRRTCAWCCATCSAGWGSRTSPPPGDRRQRRRRAERSEWHSRVRRPAGREGSARHRSRSRRAAAAAAGVRTGWKVQSDRRRPDDTLLAALARTRSSRVCCRSKPGGSRISGCAVRPVRGPTVLRGRQRRRPCSSSVERRPKTGQPVTVGNLPTMFVRVDRAASETPAGRPAGVIGFNVWMTAVDPLFQKAVDEFPRNATASSSICAGTRAGWRRC